MKNIKVLYEDNHLIAVFKPAGVLSQGDKMGDVSMLDDVRLYLMEKKNKKTPSNPSGQAGNVFLGLLHRLDRPVCGIMLFAKTSKGASRLSQQFRNHQIEKTYQAIVIGRPPQNRGVLINKLGKDEKLKKAKEYDDGQEVKLFYEVLKSNGKYSLLKITIEGGKFHQIRSQLSLAGFPILGDVKYKAKPDKSQGHFDGPVKIPPKADLVGEPMLNHSIALCATSLHFYPATSNELVKLSVEIPKEWQEYVK